MSGRDWPTEAEMAAARERDMEETARYEAECADAGVDPSPVAFLPCICQGCTRPMVWTSLYTDWCATCKPRSL